MVKNSILRGGLPLLIMTALSLIMKAQGMDGYQVKSTFITGLIISFVAAASVIYEVEGWSLFKQSVLHFLLMLVTVYPCLLVSGWFKLESAGDYGRVFAIFVTVGLVLWFIFYLIFGKLLSK